MLFVFSILNLIFSFFFFFFNDTATTEIYTLSLHDALPICPTLNATAAGYFPGRSGDLFIVPKAYWLIDGTPLGKTRSYGTDRKSTRLNSSHLVISYAVFCLKKKKHTPISISPESLNSPTHR